MNTPKEKIKQEIDSLPDDSAYDEILRELVFNRMIEKGLNDSKSGNVISNEAMLKRIKSWEK